jgi:nucleolar MIF4G domain-containing protein 1
MIAAEHTGSPKRKKAKITEPETVPINQVDIKRNKKSASKPPLRQKATSKLKSKSQTALGKRVLREDTGPPTSSLRSQREREDDKYIAYLEAKLGKGKKGAEDDGLDGITIFQSIDLFV